MDVVFPWLHLELTCVTLTSKNAVTPRDQKSPALKDEKPPAYWFEIILGITIILLKVINTQILKRNGLSFRVHTM